MDVVDCCDTCRCASLTVIYLDWGGEQGWCTMRILHNYTCSLTLSPPFSSSNHGNHTLNTLKHVQSKEHGVGWGVGVLLPRSSPLWKMQRGRDANEFVHQTSISRNEEGNRFYVTVDNPVSWLAVMMLSVNNTFRKRWENMMRERECQPLTFYKWRCKYGKIWVERRAPKTQTFKYSSDVYTISNKKTILLVFPHWEAYSNSNTRAGAKMGRESMHIEETCLL